MTKLWVLLFPVAVAGMGMLSSGCAEAQTAEVVPPTPVKVQAVQAFAAGGGLRYSATIRPSTQMELAFKNGGFIESIHSVSGRLVDKGNTVAQGTVLARIRQADFQDRVDHTTSQLMEARAALESLKGKVAENRARLERAEQDFTRAEALFATQSLTKTNYDAARSERDAAQAKVASSAADIESAQSRVKSVEVLLSESKRAFSDTALVAPMGGTILERMIEVGSLVAANKAAFVLADTRSVKAVFGLPDLEVHNVRAGMTLDITSEAAPDRKFTGRVTSIAPAADEKSRVFETEVTIPNAGDFLKPGMIASVVIGGSASSEKVAAVPLSAIVRSESGGENYAVFITETRNGQPVAQLRNVVLGDAFGNMVAIKDGLQIGENVITVGATLVQTGSSIQIVP